MLHLWSRLGHASAPLVRRAYDYVPAIYRWPAKMVQRARRVVALLRTLQANQEIVAQLAREIRQQEGIANLLQEIRHLEYCLAEQHGMLCQEMQQQRQLVQALLESANSGPTAIRRAA